MQATLKAVCLVLYPNPAEKKKDGLKTVVDWWAASKKLLGRPTLLEEMQKFDKENMEESVIKALGQYFADPEAKPDIEEDKVKNASTPCHSMLLWVRAMYDFYFVNKKVKPKKAALNEAT